MVANEQNDQKRPLIKSASPPTKQNRWSSKTFKQPYLASIILWIALSILAITIYISIQFEDVWRGTFGDCGESPSEARSLGCLYDVTSSSWLPPECYDAELINEFLALRDWVWYYNVQGNIAAPREEVLAGNLDDLIVTREYHMFRSTARINGESCIGGFQLGLLIHISAIIIIPRIVRRCLQRGRV